MANLDQVMVKSRAYQERIPMTKAASISGSGLRRSGGINPAIITALMPAVQDLAKQAISKAPGLISKGVSKAGKFFKRIFGFGIDGGARQHSSSNPDASYHDQGVFTGYMAPEDRSLYGENPKSKKYMGYAAKIKGGFSVGDVPRIVDLISTDNKFRRGLEKRYKKPHKFINYISKRVQKKN